MLFGLAEDLLSESDGSWDFLVKTESDQIESIEGGKGSLGLLGEFLTELNRKSLLHHVKLLLTRELRSGLLLLVEGLVELLDTLAELILQSLLVVLDVEIVQLAQGLFIAWSTQMLIMTDNLLKDVSNLNSSF